MDGAKLSELTAVTEIAPTDRLYPVVGGLSRAIEYANLVPLRLVGEADVSAATNSIEVAISGSWAGLVILLSDLEMDADVRVMLQAKVAGSYVTSGYAYQLRSTSTSGTANSAASNSAAGFFLTSSTGTWGVRTNFPWGGIVFVPCPVTAAGHKTIHGFSFYEFSTGNHGNHRLGGDLGTETGAWEALRLKVDGASDNLVAGRMRIWGLSIPA